MANYPTYPAQSGSRVEDEDGTVVDRAVSGKPRFRSYYSRVWRTFQVVHELDAPEWLALQAFYTANRRVSFDFLWEGDGLTYVCRFGRAPQGEPQAGGYWRVNVTLVVV